MSCNIFNKGTPNLIECHDMLDKLKKVTAPIGQGKQGKVYILEDLNYAIKVIPKIKHKNILDDEAEDYESDVLFDTTYSDEDNTYDGGDRDEDGDEVGDDHHNEEDYEDNDEEDDEDDEGTSEEEFSSEVEILNKIKCPNVIKYYGAYEDEDNYYLVTEAIKGSHLKNFKFEEREIIECVKQMVKGLQCIHKAGIAHNDINLDNIMYDDKKSIYYIDFGLSCAECENKDTGNDFYTAPEFLSNFNYKKNMTLEKLQKNDLWALGLVIIQIILWEEKNLQKELEFARNFINPYINTEKEDILTIIKKTLLNVMKKVSLKINNEYIINLLKSLTEIDPKKRKLI